MNKLIRAAAIGLFLLPLLLGAKSQAQSRDAQIEDLKKQMEAIQQQNQRELEELREKITSLESQKQADREKMEELTKEEEDAWYKKVEIGYKKAGDGFTIKSKDGNYSLRTRLRTQFQFSVNDTDGEDTATDFNIRRFRIIWDGNAFTPWFLYYIQVSADNNGDFTLRDAYFDIAYNKMFAPRVGQYKVPFSREELTSSSELQLVERSIVNDEFAFGRDRGASIYGVLGNYITYGAGIFNGDGRNGVSTDSNLLYAGRIMFTPCCGELKYGGTFPAGGDYKIEPNFGLDKPLIAFGAALAVIPGLNIGNKTPDNDIDGRFDEIFGGDVIDSGGAEADVFALTADANFKYSIFSAEAEYQFRTIDPDDGTFEETTDQGFRIQAGLFIVPEFIEVAGRFAYIAFDDDVDGRESRYEITPGLNFYLSKSHRWKVQLSYSFINDEDTDGEEIDQNVLRAQLQAYF
ncbi:MAG: porin [Thermodesulfobacteriota bacterium]